MTTTMNTPRADRSKVSYRDQSKYIAMKPDDVQAIERAMRARGLSFSLLTYKILYLATRGFTDFSIADNLMEETP